MFSFDRCARRRGEGLTATVQDDAKFDIVA